MDPDLDFVLDSLPVVGYLKNERPLADRIEPYFIEARRGQISLSISLGNWIEILYIMRRNKISLRIVNEAREVFGLKIVGLTETFAEEVAKFKADYPIALGDSFAAALAWVKRAPLLTTDPEFKALEKKIKIIWLN